MTHQPLSDALVEELRLNLGEENIVVSAADLELTTRTCIPYQEIPAAIVYPSTAEQVQIVMRCATKYKVPVWTVSTGKELGVW